MISKILDNYVREEYRKIKNLHEIRSRGNKVLMFYELTACLPQLSTRFFFSPYEFILLNLVLTFSTLTLLFLSLYTQQVNIFFPACVGIVNAFLFVFKFEITKNIYDLKQDLPFILHKLLDKKDVREQELIAEINTCILEYSQTHTSHSEVPGYLELLQRDPKEFIFKHFNIKSSHFINYYMERAYDPLTRELNKTFIKYSLFIPKKEELGADLLRKILIHPVRIEKFNPELIDTLFTNYSPLQIEALFTSFYGKEKIDDLFNLPSEPIPVYRNFATLLNTELYRDKTLTKELKSLLNTPYEGIRIEVLRTLQDYEHAGYSLFKNCLGKSSKNYFTRGGHIILFFEKEKPWACVHVKDFSPKEIKGFENKEVMRKYRVEEILREHGVIR